MAPIVRADPRNDRPWTRSRRTDYRLRRPPQERRLRTRAIAASIVAARGRAGRRPLRPSPGWRRGLLKGVLLARVLAASVTAAGCVIQQRAQGVLPTQPLPPPPSEPGVKAANPAAAQASPPAPERKPLSVPR
jgi:hypothetical protein